MRVLDVQIRDDPRLETVARIERQLVAAQLDNIHLPAANIFGGRIWDERGCVERLSQFEMVLCCGCAFGTSFNSASKMITLTLWIDDCCVWILVHCPSICARP